MEAWLDDDEDDYSTLEDDNKDTDVDAADGTDSLVEGTDDNDMGMQLVGLVIPFVQKYDAPTMNDVVDDRTAMDSCKEVDPLLLPW